MSSLSVFEEIIYEINSCTNIEKISQDKCIVGIVSISGLDLKNPEKYSGDSGKSQHEKIISQEFGNESFVLHYSQLGESSKGL
jgi:hypothetical protein